MRELVLQVVKRLHLWTIFQAKPRLEVLRFCQVAEVRGGAAEKRGSARLALLRRVGRVSTRPHRTKADIMSDLATLLDFVWDITSISLPEGECQPTLYTQDDSSAITTRAFHWSNEVEKDDIIMRLRQMLRASSFVRYVIVHEAWAASYPANEASEFRTPPSQRDDRMDLLVAIGAERDSPERIGRAAEIVTAAGGKRSLGEWSNFSDCCGKFFNLFDEASQTNSPTQH